MSVNYQNFDQEDSRSSEIAGPPQHFAPPVGPQGPVNILSGPAYQLSKSQREVQKWNWWIKLFGYIILIIGAVRTFGTVLDLLFAVGQSQFESDDEEEDLEIDVPFFPLFLAGLCNLALSLLLVFLGWKFVQTSGKSSRLETWKLVKTASLVVLASFVLITIMYFFIFVGFGSAIGEWIEEGEEPEGEYNLTHKSTGHTVKVHKRSRSEEPEEEVEEGYDEGGKFL